MPNKFVNESKPYKVIHETAWSQGKEGLEKKTRLIVIEFDQKSNLGKWAVRWQSYDGATFHGGAFNSELEAYKAFSRRVVEHNRSYPMGNISHLPGILK